MIVAVRDFNFGAMENKGLNIFNSSLLLADPATATDVDYERIEGVVAHEYFHNWTGDRITCRDWFQLCLKEGLTVFRDQSFSADMRGEAVQRIKEVKALRARQFSEDAGPLAHPVRPSSYIKIDNFYTATIYEKGAEVIRMLKTMIGADGFRAGMDLYFERWDGQATTVEAFIAVLRRGVGPRPLGLLRLVRAGRHADGDAGARLRRRGAGARPHPRAGDRADARPAGQAAAADPGRHRPARRGRPAAARHRGGGAGCAVAHACGSRTSTARAGGLGAARLLRAGEPQHRRAGRRTPTCCWPPTRTCSTAGKPARAWPAT